MNSAFIDLTSEISSIFYYKDTMKMDNIINIIHFIIHVKSLFTSIPHELALDCVS